MDEEYKIIEKLVGDKHKYQKVTLLITMLVWFATSFIHTTVSYLEKKPNVRYYNTTSGEYISDRLTYEICENYNYTIERTYDYSFANFYEIDCNKLKIGFMGVTICFAVLIGAIIQTFLVNYVGRKRTLIASLICFIVIILAMNFLPKGHDNFYFIYIFFFLLELCASCSYISSFLYICEMNTFENRPIYSGFVNASYSICGLMHIIIFRFFNDRLININVTFVLSTIAVLLVIFIFYESPMFFFIKGNFTKFLVNFRNIAKFNGRFYRYEKYLSENVEMLEKMFYYEEVKENDTSIPKESISDGRYTFTYQSLGSFQESYEQVDPENQEAILKQGLEIRKIVFDVYKNDSFDSSTSMTDLDLFEKKYKRIDKKKYIYGVFDLLKFPSQRYNCLKLCFICFVSFGAYNTISNVFVYYKGSLEINGMIYYAIEMIFYFSSGYIINFRKIGRIKLMVVWQIVALIGYLIYNIFTLPGYSKNVVATAIKISISSTCVINYIYSYEVYPLVLSSNGVVVSFIVGKFGATIFLMLIEFLGDRIFIVFGILQGLCLFIMLTLPETVKRNFDQKHPPEVDEELVN